MNYAIYNPPQQHYDFDVEEEERAWVYDPLVLVWPPQNMLRFSPFESHLTRAERLNAHARLTLLLGLAMFWFHYTLALDTRGGGGESWGLLVLFLTLVAVANQGVNFLNESPLLPPPPRVQQQPHAAAADELEFYKRLVLELRVQTLANSQELLELRRATLRSQQHKQQQIQLFNPIF